MNNKILSCLMAGALGTALALASPALAFRGGGGGGGGGGGMHAGGMGGGMHAGGMGGGMHAAGIGGGAHFGAMSGGAHFGAMSGGTHFSGSRFASTPFAAHAAISPRFSRFAFRDGFHHRFHHRFHRFAFVGAPLVFAAYDSCWRKVWTPYGLQWINVCDDYGYGY